MRYSGGLFELAERWRNEAETVRTRHGAEGNARSLESAAADLETDLVALFNRTYKPKEAAELTGYCERQVARWIADKTVAVNENGEIALLDLPVKPGYLARLLGLGPALRASDRQPRGLGRARSSRR